MKLIRRFKILIVLILLVSFLLPTCAKTNKEVLPVFPIPASDLNSEIVITKLDGINTYKYGDYLRFGVTNISDHNINMGKYYSPIIYIKHEGEWLEVKDGTNIHSYSDIILGHGKDVSRLGGRSVNPIIPFESKSYEILVYVAGDMIEENGIAIKKVGAYRIFQLRDK